MDFAPQPVVGVVATWLMLTIASPTLASATIDEAVSSCAQQYGVTTGYSVKSLTVGGEQSYFVPPGGTVSESRSEQINACIARVIALRSGRQPTINTDPPLTAATCRAEYNQKLRLTGGVQSSDSRSVNKGFLGRLFGRRLGRNLLENEYDRCLRKVAYGRNECPNGVFVGGSGYCVRRPYR